MLKLCSILVFLCFQVENSFGCGQLDYVYDLTTCIQMRWLIQCERDDFEVYVDDCNGTSHTFSLHSNNKGYIDFGFRSIYCKSNCLIRFQDSNQCILLNKSSDYRKSKKLKI